MARKWQSPKLQVQTAEHVERCTSILIAAGVIEVKKSAVNS
jgi:hypothetical protein